MIFVGSFRKEKKSLPFNNYLSLNKYPLPTASSSNFTSGLNKTNCAHCMRVYFRKHEGIANLSLEASSHTILLSSPDHIDLSSSADDVNTAVTQLSKSVVFAFELIKTVIWLPFIPPTIHCGIQSLSMFRSYTVISLTQDDKSETLK